MTRGRDTTPPLPAELPRVYCPVCRNGFELDDYYGVEEGSERACAKCGAMLECVEVEVTKTCTWQSLEDRT